MEKPTFILRNWPLARYSTLNIGGPADFFAEIKSEEELCEAWEYSRDNKLNVFILGGGSNILFSDKGYRGLVLRICSNKIKQDSEGELLVESGATIASTVGFGIRNGLYGFENFAGLPGTVGGAIYGNAGCYGAEFGSRVKAVRIFDGEYIREIKIDNSTPFSYRSSFLKDKGWVILGAKLEVKKKDSVLVREKVQRIFNQRTSAQPNYRRTIGCVFKNPKSNSTGRRVSAGLMMELAGIRGKRIGKAKISKKHCNIFVNLGSATAKDFGYLIEWARDKVRDKFGITLEEEITRVGEF